MALTRSMLKGMNLTEEQVSAIIEGHKETVDALKEQRDNYKADAEKLADVQKELNELKNGKDWKGEYDKEHKAFEDYKTEIAGRETQQKVKDAYRALLEGLNIDKADVDLIMASVKAEDMKLDADGKLEKSDELTADAKTRFARYIPTTSTKGAKVENPPKNDGSTLTKADIYAKDEKGRYKMTTAERQRALVEHPELMKRSE